MPIGRVRHARIEDVDRPLHRIFPLWHFEQVCRVGQLTLVKPSLWIDPREDPCANFMLTPMPGSPKTGQRQLADYLAACWAQCWSYEADSDVLLRAYSRVLLDPISKRNTTPAEEGVRVTTTVRRLIAVMEAWTQKHSDFHFYIAGVLYESEQDFGRGLAARLKGVEGPRYFSTPDGRAESLCVKRTQFGHESEVRVLCVGSNRLGTGEDIQHFSIAPNDAFTEVAFDPRLMSFERREREERLRAIGYTGPIREDKSYDGVFNIVPLADWPEPEFDNRAFEPSREPKVSDGQ